MKITITIPTFGLEKIKTKLKAKMSLWLFKRLIASGAEVKLEPEKLRKKGFYTARTSQTGDKVYLIDEKEKTRKWIKNPYTLSKLGFTLGNEDNISYSDLTKFKDAGSIDLKEKVIEKPTIKKESQPKPVKTESKTKPVLGYKESATLEDFEKYNE